MKQQIILFKYSFIIILFLMASKLFASKQEYGQTTDSLEQKLKIIEANRMLNPDSSIKLGRELLFSDYKNYSISDKIKLNVYQANSFVFAQQLDSTFFYFEKAINLTRENNDKDKYYDILGNIGAIYSEQGKFDTAKYLLDKSLEYFSNNAKENDSEFASLYLNLGNLYLRQNRLNYALTNYMKALDLELLKKNPEKSIRVLNSIGAVYRRLGEMFRVYNSSKSISYLKKSTMYFDTAYKYCLLSDRQFEIDYILINWASALHGLGDYALADSLLQLKPVATNSKDSYLVIMDIILKAKSESCRGNSKSALKILDKLEDLKGFENTIDYHQVRLYQLRLLDITGDNFESFLPIVSNSVQWLFDRQLYTNVDKAANTIMKLYEEKNEMKKALYWSKIASESKDRYNSDVVVNKEISDELQIKHQTDLLHKELEITKEKSKRQKQQKMGVAIVSSLLIWLSLMVIVALNLKKNKAFVKLELSKARAQKLDKEVKLKESEAEKLKLEKDLYQENEKKKGLELEMKSRDLIYQSTKNIEISNIQKEMIEKLKPFLVEIPKKKKREEYYSMIQSLNNELKVDYLAQFETVFSQTYGGFNNKLLNLNPDITRSELYVAALLRLNMSSKEMAQILNLSPNTIDKTRHQLRQKLNLKSGDNLNTFIINL